MEVPTFTDALLRFNTLVAQIILVVTFSLLFYIATRNWRNMVTRATALLLLGVVIVFSGDVLLDKAVRESTRQFLLRAQWLGIVLVPAAYLHLSDAILTSVGLQSLRRRWGVVAGYICALIFFALAAGTNALVRGRIENGPLEQLAAGPLFWLFTIWFGLVTVGGLYNIYRARQLHTTTASRRRMTYLGVSFLAPGLGVFPYLVVASLASSLPAWIVLSLAIITNMGVGAMILVLAYSVAYQGALLPDRIVKQDFIRWLLVGPLVGVSVIVCFQVLPLFENVLGLPRDTIITFGVMIFTVVIPNLIDYVRPRLENLLLWQDRDQLQLLRRFDRKAFTRTDLRHLLENTLVTICGAMRAECGFVAAPEGDSAVVKASVGPRHVVKHFFSEHKLPDLLEQSRDLPSRKHGAVPEEINFLPIDGYCILPLHSSNGTFLGVVGVACPPSGTTLEVRRLIGVLAHQMELALENVQLQERIYATLQGMTPEMQSLQQMASHLDHISPASLEQIDADVAMLPNFDQLVQEALKHYWGGPKLSESPLLGLRSVRNTLNETGSSTKALQLVLRRAIENLRPDEQLEPTAQEWVLYNILHLRFLQGLRIREIVLKLAMSESDFYRKQRVAVEEVARQLALMEEHERR
ncbi:MAG TPA: histidine kinase N-terminal 7TM domain-containing protein [Herpetosiphonaceae bacterium]